MHNLLPMLIYATRDSILSRAVQMRLTNILLEDEGSARDNHLLPCTRNFAKKSPFKKIHRQTQQ